jgi:predicted transposase YdaD
MLLEEWTWEEAEALMREEGREMGRKEGREMGREEGRREGIEEGRMEIARNLLAAGSPPEFIQKITGVDI